VGVGVTGTSSGRVELQAGTRLVTITSAPGIERMRHAYEQAADRTLKRAFLSDDRRAPWHRAGIEAKPVISAAERRRRFVSRFDLLADRRNETDESAQTVEEIFGRGSAPTQCVAQRYNRDHNSPYPGIRDAMRCGPVHTASS
jgi:hypothetical protein